MLLLSWCPAATPSYLYVLEGEEDRHCTRIDPSTTTSYSGVLCCGDGVRILDGRAQDVCVYLYIGSGDPDLGVGHHDLGVGLR